jgi:SNF2 family DNA or RNA helicase
MEQQRLAIESNIIVTNPEKYVQDLVAACGKMQLLHRMLPTLQKNGHRCLIFSQFTRMLDILEDYLDYSGYKYCRIDGAIAQKDRQVAVRPFSLLVFKFRLTLVKHPRLIHLIRIRAISASCYQPELVD